MNNKFKLSVKQQLIVNAGLDSSTVIGVPGAGKTKIIIEIIKYLISNGVDPRAILVASKTITAIKCLDKRLVEECKIYGTRVVRLEQESYKVAKDYLSSYGISKCQIKVLEDLIKEFLHDESSSIKDMNNYQATKIIQGFNLKNEEEIIKRITDDEYSVRNLILKSDELYAKSKQPNLDAAQREEYVKQYLKYKYMYFKKMHNYFDFNEINKIAIYMLKTGMLDDYLNNYSVFILDEMNDTNEFGVELINWFRQHQKVFKLFGDMNQSILVFTGAVHDKLVEFTHEASDMRVFHLNESFRHPKAILNYINCIGHQIDSNYIDATTTNEDGVKPKYITYQDKYKEIDGVIKMAVDLIKSGIAPKDIAIISNTNRDVKSFANHAKHFKVQFKIWGYTNAAESLIKALLSYAVNKDDESIEVLSEYLDLIAQSDFKTIKALSSLYQLPIYSYLHSEHYEDKNEEFDNYFAELDAFIQREFESGVLSYEFINRYLAVSNVHKFFNSPQTPVKAGSDYTYMMRQIEDYFKSFKHRQCESSIREFLVYINSIISDDNKINIMTPYQAKGEEFKYVFVTGLVNGEFPVRCDTEDDIKHQLQVYYVSVSRATECLILSNFLQNYKKEPFQESIFLSYGRDLYTRMGELEFSEDDTNMPELKVPQSAFNEGDKVKHKNGMFESGVVVKVDNFSVEVQFNKPGTDVKMQLRFSNAMSVLVKI